MSKKIKEDINFSSDEHQAIKAERIIGNPKIFSFGALIPSRLKALRAEMEKLEKQKNRYFFELKKRFGGK